SVVGTNLVLTYTPALPTVTTTAATAITNNSATLNASASANGNSTALYFQYGLTASYGSFSSTNTITGTTTNNSGAVVSGLSPATLYHFRAVAANTVSTNFGSDLTFTTLAG